MAETHSAVPFRNRRLQPRYPLPVDAEAALSFRYPFPNGATVEARLRDISLSGLSLVLPEALSRVQVGDIVNGIEARVAAKRFRGDLLVMHVTGSGEQGAVCGGLFYPEGDEDLITIRLVLRSLEAAARG